MVHLLDVNVLIALAWPSHIHHAPATLWFSSRRAEGWATAPTTEFAFVRISSNRAAMDHEKTPGEVIALLREMRDEPGHVDWVDDVSPSDPDLVDPRRLVGHRQVTDAHLLALARRHGGAVATFDRGLRALAGADADERVVLIPPAV